MNALVACHAVKAMGRIALRLPAKANLCIEALISLLNQHITYITSQIVIVMTGKYNIIYSKPFIHLCDINNM